MRPRHTRWSDMRSWRKARRAGTPCPLRAEALRRLSPSRKYAASILKQLQMLSKENRASVSVSATHRSTSQERFRCLERPERKPLWKVTSASSSTASIRRLVGLTVRAAASASVSTRELTLGFNDCLHRSNLDAGWCQERRFDDTTPLVVEWLHVAGDDLPLGEGGSFAFAGACYHL
jgi:hypothetical protein